jgi:hypothetical protein
VIVEVTFDLQITKGGGQCASVKWHSAFLAPFPTFSAIYWSFCNFCSTGKAMYQLEKVDRYFRWGIRSFLAGGKKKLEKSSAALLM